MLKHRKFRCLLVWLLRYANRTSNLKTALTRKYRIVQIDKCYSLIGQCERPGKTNLAEENRENIRKSVASEENNVIPGKIVKVLTMPPKKKSEFYISIHPHPYQRQHMYLS